ncbi:hypothetical protein K3495_g13794, partial [Podosphaera aphanis]
MTGVNRTRAAWVSKQELDHRRATGACVRCGKKGHRISNCRFLPPQRPEAAVKAMGPFEDQIESNKSDRVQRLSDRIEKVGEQTIEDIKAAKAMNGTSFVIDTLINNLISVPTLIDNGCECLAAVSNSIVRKARLPRLQISPRKLTKATNDNQGKSELITEMTKMEIDIDGYKRTLYAYIIPQLSHGLILGKPWMERENVVYHARNKFMEIHEAMIGDSPLRVWEKGARTQGICALNIASLSAGVFLATVRRARKSSGGSTQLFSVSLADIQKALAPSKKAAKIPEKLPPEYKDFINLFKNEVTDKLPPHRLGYDHEIKLDPGKEIPWGPLYGMSRDELLVLRKTITELLDKNYIRASSSPAGAPVLFVRKPGGVLRKLQDAGLGLDIDKCEFSVQKTKYLGFIISSEDGNSSVRMDPEKVRAILEWEAPTTTKGLRGFLGFANFYRGFIDGFSRICAPLTALTGKGTPWKWGPEQEEAFNALKLRFITEPALAQWDPDRETMLEADCSGYALGGCLLQKQDEGSWKPVAYYSKKLSGAEMNYEIHDKELLAIVVCMKEWDAELRGLAKPFNILSDHMNLKYFLTRRRLTERQIRWAEFLSRFRYMLQFRKGSESERPDALSRRDQDKPKDGDPRLLSRERQALSPINIVKLSIEGLNIVEGGDIFVNEDLQKLWNQGLREDSNFLKIVRAVENGERTWPKDLRVCTEGSNETKPLQAMIAASSFDRESGILYYQGRIWVPMFEPLTTAIIQNTHDSTVSGHPGRDATLSQVARSYFWPGISKAVKRFCKNCDICGRSSIWRHQKQGLLKPLPVPDQFHQELS